jgi:hypothetical protein
MHVYSVRNPKVIFKQPMEIFVIARPEPLLFFKAKSYFSEATKIGESLQLRP